MGIDVGLRCENSDDEGYEGGRYVVASGQDEEGVVDYLLLAHDAFLSIVTLHAQQIGNEILGGRSRALQAGYPFGPSEAGEGAAGPGARPECAAEAGERHVQRHRPDAVHHRFEVVDERVSLFAALF